MAAFKLKAVIIFAKVKSGLLAAGVPLSGVTISSLAAMISAALMGYSVGKVIEKGVKAGMARAAAEWIARKFLCLG